MHFVRISIAAMCLVLGACGGDETATGPVTQQPAGPALSAAQQPLYDTYCKVCHGAEGSGAPYSGRHADWEARAVAGMDTLLSHSLEGYRGMPPMGGCFTCTEEDMRALIVHMSGGLAR